jgi:hypothetical protein
MRIALSHDVKSVSAAVCFLCCATYALVLIEESELIVSCSVLNSLTYFAFIDASSSLLLIQCAQLSFASCSQQGAHHSIVSRPARNKRLTAAGITL